MILLVVGVVLLLVGRWLVVPEQFASDTCAFELRLLVVGVLVVVRVSPIGLFVDHRQGQG